CWHASHAVPWGVWLPQAHWRWSTRVGIGASDSDLERVPVCHTLDLTAGSECPDGELGREEAAGVQAPTLFLELQELLFATGVGDRLDVRLDDGRQDRSSHAPLLLQLQRARAALAVDELSDGLRRPRDIADRPRRRATDARLIREQTQHL